MPLSELENDSESVCYLWCPFSPRDVLDEIWDESVSEGFSTYSWAKISAN